MIADVVGFLAGILIGISILPQIIKSLKTRKVEDISFLMLLIIIFGEILWVIYGIMIKSSPIIAVDGFALLATLIMIYIKIFYKSYMRLC